MTNRTEHPAAEQHPGLSDDEQRLLAELAETERRDGIRYDGLSFAPRRIGEIVWRECGECGNPRAAIPRYRFPDVCIVCVPGGPADTPKRRRLRSAVLLRERLAERTEHHHPAVPADPVRTGFPARPRAMTELHATADRNLFEPER